MWHGIHLRQSGRHSIAVNTRGEWGFGLFLSGGAHGSLTVSRDQKLPRRGGSLSPQHCATTESAGLGGTWLGGRSRWACGRWLGAEIRTLASPQLPQVTNVHPPQATKMPLGLTIST